MSNVYLSNVTLSFPHLEKPSEKFGKYSADFIMNEKHEGFQNFVKTYSELLVEAFKDKSKIVLAQVMDDRNKRCFGRGTEKKDRETMEVLNGYSGEGTVYISSSDKKQPQIIGPDGKKIDKDNTIALAHQFSKLYGGAKVNAVIHIWIQNNESWGKGIRCNLVAIQFFKDGTPFGEANDDDASSLFKATEESSSMPGLPDFLK